VKISAIDKFTSMYEVDSSTGCWNWVRGGDKDGYGLFRDGKKYRAHRWSYTHHVGEIPEGLVLDHFACDNKGCVNPEHVRPVTVRENTLRGRANSAANLAKTHCKYGHALVPENLTPAGLRQGKRQCLICSRTRPWEANDGED
jgi:hypothetical protein